MVKENIQLLEDLKFVPTKTVLMSKVVFDENNPNVMSDEKHEAFDKVLTKWGFAKDPWLNERKDGTYLVIDGEQGIRRMQAHNVKKFQAKVFSVTYAQVRMLRQIANKLHGEHDKTKDAEEFKGIFDNKKLEEFAQMLGEPIESFQEILKKKFDISFGKEEQEIPEPPVKPKSKLGDIYQLGNHRVMCGDSTKNLEKLINGTVMNLLFTDPPYGISVVQNGGIGGDGYGFTANSAPSSKLNGKLIHRRLYKKIEGDDVPFDPTFLLNLSKIQIIFGANHFTDKLPKNSHWLVWDKKQGEQEKYTDNFSDAELMWTNISKLVSVKTYRHVWNGMTRKGDRESELKERVHPTQKPVGLLSEIIKDYSEENHTVLDPYLGSGSTLIACEQTNRVCYGMELDPAYVDVIIQRWENFTGQKAKLETSLK